MKKNRKLQPWQRAVGDLDIRCGQEIGRLDADVEIISDQQLKGLILVGVVAAIAMLAHYRLCAIEDFLIKRFS